MLVKPFFDFFSCVRQVVDFGGFWVLKRLTLGLASAAILGACAAPTRAGGCLNWNTAEFFERAPLHEVETCLAMGADANATDDRQRTPLLFATGLGREEVALALLAGGARPTARSDDGDTALLLAHGTGHLGWSLRLTTALLAAGADPNVANVRGFTALHGAVMAVEPGQ